MNRQSPRLARLLAVLLASGWGLATAGDWRERIQLHGFASQALLWTSDNRLFGDSDDRVALDLRELGVNLSWLPNPRLQLSGQLISRRAGETDDGEPRVDYLFADLHRPHPAGRLGLRLGRVKNPYAHYNLTRDVPMTRPSILLPQSVYFDQTRRLSLSSDGLMLYGDVDSRPGRFSAELQYGRPLDDPNVELTAFEADLPGRVEANNAWLARLAWEPAGSNWSLAVSHTEVPLRYRPRPLIPDLAPGRLDLKVSTLSLQQHWEFWTLTAEYSRRVSSNRGLQPLPDQRDIGAAWYVQLAHRWHPDWELLLRHDQLCIDRSDCDGEAHALRTGTPAHRRQARDWTLGLRWDATPRLMLRAEYHHIEGTAWLPVADNLGRALSGNWDLIAVSVTYHF